MFLGGGRREPESVPGRASSRLLSRVRSSAAAVWPFWLSENMGAELMEGGCAVRSMERKGGAASHVGPGMCLAL